MSAFRFYCPHCGSGYNGDDKFENMHFFCQNCQKEITVQRPGQKNVPKTNTKGSPVAVVGCLLFVVWLLAFFVAGWNYSNSNASVYIFFSLPAFLLIAGVVYAIKKTIKEKKLPESIIPGVVMLMLIVSVIVGIVFLCRSCEASMESKVEEKAFGIAYLSTGQRASGFHADNTIVGKDKAVCHFRYKINGEEFLSSIEFKIENGEPIPIGKFIVDEN